MKNNKKMQSNKVTDKNTNKVTNRIDKCSNQANKTNKVNNEIGFDSETDCR